MASHRRRRAHPRRRGSGQRRRTSGHVRTGGPIMPLAHRGSPSRVGPRRWSWVRVVARVQLPHPADVACRPYSGWPRQGPIRRCWAPSDHHPARHDPAASHGDRPTPLCGRARHPTAIGTGGSDDAEALRGWRHRLTISRASWTLQPGGARSPGITTAEDACKTCPVAARPGGSWQRAQPTDHLRAAFQHIALHHEAGVEGRHHEHHPTRDHEGQEGQVSILRGPTTSTTGDSRGGRVRNRTRVCLICRICAPTCLPNNDDIPYHGGNRILGTRSCLMGQADRG
jgi:hypothetical protein